MSEPDRGRTGLDVEIVFHGSDRVPEMERFVSNQVGEIEQVFGRMKGWHVVLGAPERRHPHTGRLFNVMIRVTVPSGDEIAIENHPTELEAHEDSYKSISDAFASLSSRLQASLT